MALLKAHIARHLRPNSGNKKGQPITLFLEKKSEAGEGATDQAGPCVLLLPHLQKNAIREFMDARDSWMSRHRCLQCTPVHSTSHGRQVGTADGETETDGIELDLVGLLVLEQVG